MFSPDYRKVSTIKNFRLNVALGSLVWRLVTLHTAGGLKLDDHCGPFQPRPSYDSMKKLFGKVIFQSLRKKKNQLN